MKGGGEGGGALRSKNRAGAVLLGIAVALGLLLRGTGAGARGSGKALFVVGDSYADTGNHDPLDATLSAPWKVPYGRAWPGRPSGRFSDGRLLTDLYASSHGLLSPLPYRLLKELNTTSNLLECGINFAFGGSGIFPTFGPKFPTVDDQIYQLQGLIDDGLYAKEFLESSFVLFIVAGNDYTEYNIQHPDGKGVMDFSTRLIVGISSSLFSLYNLGFRNFVVTTLPPFGCFPSVTKLLNFSSCNAEQNLITSHHNDLLRETIARLKEETQTHFTILDLERAFKIVLQVGKSLQLQWRSCCEGLGNASCGDQDNEGGHLYTLCSSSDHYFFWDNAHPSNIGWKLVFEVLSDL